MEMYYLIMYYYDYVLLCSIIDYVLLFDYVLFNYDMQKCNIPVLFDFSKKSKNYEIFPDF